MAHAPQPRTSDDDRQAFYTDFSEAFSDRNEMDTRVVLIDANTGPGEWRDGRSNIVGPHGIPLAKKGSNKMSTTFSSIIFVGIITYVWDTHGFGIGNHKS